MKGVEAETLAVLRDRRAGLEEFARLRAAAPRPGSCGGALAASVALAAWGNGAVVASRWLGHSPLVALVGHPVLAASVLGGLVRQGWAAGDLGLVPPRLRRSSGAALGVVGLAGLAVLVGVPAALVRGGGGDQRGPGGLGVELVRLLVGTAFGEEALFRGALLAAWAATPAPPRAVAAAHAASFGLWHVAAAWHDGRFHPVEVAVPAAGSCLFLWGRLRFGSLGVPWLLHAATNLCGLVVGR